jgi:hypothetical protein
MKCEYFDGVTDVFVCNNNKLNVLEILIFANSLKNANKLLIITVKCVCLMIFRRNCSSYIQREWR